MVDFELIKGNIARYQQSSILISVHKLLVAVENNKDKKYPFWDALILIKWAYLYTTDSPLRKTASIKDVQHTMILISKLHEQINPVDFKKNGIHSGFKIIAYQQFWFQDSIDEYSIFRTHYFFNNINSQLDVEKEFQTRTGLTTHLFIKTCYYLYSYFFLDRVKVGHVFDGILDDDVIHSFRSFLGQNEFDRFIQLISFNPSEAEKLQRIRYEPYQLYETTLWNRFPLLNINGKLCFVHRAILIAMIKHFIFDFLKKTSKEFQTEVGNRMEKYIMLGIQEMNVGIMNEKALRLKYESRKICDFVIDGNILIECKAIGIAPTAGINRTKELLRSEFDSTLIKACVQLVATANAMQLNTPLYGIVITYKDTYTGFGKDAWSEFLDEPVSNCLKKEAQKIELLPPDRIVFITIEDWDRLVRLKVLLNVNLSGILDLAFEQANSGQVLFFEQALDNLCRGKVLPELSYLEHIRSEFEIEAA
jgi:hypothetical protein